MSTQGEQIRLTSEDRATTSDLVISKRLAEDLALALVMKLHLVADDERGLQIIKVTPR